MKINPIYSLSSERIAAINHVNAQIRFVRLFFQKTGVLGSVIHALCDSAELLKEETRRLKSDLEIVKFDFKTIRSQALDLGLIEVYVCLGCGKENCGGCPCGTGKALRRMTDEEIMRVVHS